MNQKKNRKTTKETAVKNNGKAIGIAIGAFAVLLIIGIAGFVSAAPSWAGQGNGVNGTLYAQHNAVAEQILETGTYQDLVSARTQDGINYMPFVTSESQFVQMQEQHAQMEQYREENGIESGGLGLMQRRGAQAGGHGQNQETGNGMMRGYARGYGNGQDLGNSEAGGYGCPMWD